MSRLLSILTAGIVLLVAPSAMAAQDHAKRPTGVRLEPLFALSDHHGRALNRTDVRGKPFLVIFGYTSCPEVCPTSLFEASQLLDQLGPDRDRLGVLFVTVDPDRDTVEHLRTYLGSFHPQIKGLTGSIHQVAAVAAAFGAPIEKNAASGSTYSMSHSSQVYFMDRYGLLARPVPYNQPEALAAVTRRLLAQ